MKLFLSSVFLEDLLTTLLITNCFAVRLFNKHFGDGVDNQN